jgi:peptidoglycan/xylan/chitin deacetylase (PgdA/CDA1 family)
MKRSTAMLRSSKLALLRMARTAGLDALLLGSAWRRRRLLILCYHGVSLDDEHRWSGLYVPPEHFRRRLEILARERCAVLPLDSAVRGLREGTLPERAVSITFDDGFHDFYAAAWPALRDFGFPATVYLSTYYCFRNSPVFDPMCAYLLWKGRGRALSWPEVLADTTTVDEGSLRPIRDRIFRYCRERDLSAAAKDDLLRDLAGRLGCDLEDLCRRRILHLMTPEECAEAAAGGVDLQLHTHRHRVSREREVFWKEIDDNRAALAKGIGQGGSALLLSVRLHAARVSLLAGGARRGLGDHVQRGAGQPRRQRLSPAAPVGPAAYHRRGVRGVDQRRGGPAAAAVHGREFAPVARRRRPLKPCPTVAHHTSVFAY